MGNRNQPMNRLTGCAVKRPTSLVVHHVGSTDAGGCGKMRGVTTDQKVDEILRAVRAVASAKASVLEPHGWQITVVDRTDDDLPVVAEIVVAHPLRPGETHFPVTVDSTVPAARQFLGRCFKSLGTSLEVTGARVVRPERWAMLCGLRGVAGWPEGGEAAADAIRSAGYVLYEESILTREEARWLDKALDRDKRRWPQG